MLLTQLKIMTTALLVAAPLCSGAGLVAPPQAKEQPSAQKASVSAGSAVRVDEKELKVPFIKWTEKDRFPVGNDPHDPLVIKDKVVVGTDQGDLIAFQCKDGISIGTRKYGKRIYHSLSNDGARIYFSSSNGLTAVDIDNGALIWKLDLTCCDGPTIAVAKQGMVYVGGNDGNLYAVDATTGKQRWSSDFLTDAPPDRPKFPSERARATNNKARPSALATDGDTLFLSVFDQSRLIAIDATTGKRLWSFQADGWIFGAAVASPKHVFIGSQDKAFYCLDKQTGLKVWGYQTKGRIESGGAVDARFVYFGSCDGGLYCLNQSDGKLLWRFAADQQDGRSSAIYSVPLLHGPKVCFAAGEGQVYAADRQTGKLQWKIRPSEKSELYCSLARDGDLLFLVTRAKTRGEGQASLVAIGVK